MTLSLASRPLFQPWEAPARVCECISESWSANRETLTLLLSGASGASYELSAWNPEQISSVEGAELEQKTGAEEKVRVKLPVSAPGSDPQAKVIFHFAAR